jgi:hypothetical protein
MELPDDILLRHHDAARVRSCPQPRLFELTNLGIFGHDKIGENDYVVEIKCGVGQGLWRK